MSALSPSQQRHVTSLHISFSWMVGTYSNQMILLDLMMYILCLWTCHQDSHLQLLEVVHQLQSPNFLLLAKPIFHRLCLLQDL